MLYNDGMTEQQILTDNGLSNAGPIVQAANEFGVELAILAAFAQAESNGKMIYGHDANGVYSTNRNSYNVPDDIGGMTKYAPGSNIAVTPENYWGNDKVRGFYNRVIIDNGTSNGVGIFHLTYKGFLVDAMYTGFDLATPLDNARYGAKLIKSYLKGLTTSDQILRAAKRYNTGNETGYQNNAYAARILSYTDAWRRALEGRTPSQSWPQPTTTTTTTPAPTVDAPVSPVEAPVSTDTTTTIPNASPGTRWTTRALNLRTEPTVASNLIVTMPAKAKVFASGQSTADGWMEVKYKKYTGWAYGGRLTAIKPRRWF